MIVRPHDREVRNAPSGEISIMPILSMLSSS